MSKFKVHRLTKKRLPKRLEKLRTSKLGVKIETKLEKIETRIETQLESVETKALALRETATQAVDEVLDQVLLGLQHKGLNIKELSLKEFNKESQDLIQSVSLRVLQRAEAVRSQLAANPRAPSWLKDMTILPKDAAPEASAETTADVSAEAPVEGMLADDEATVAEAAKAAKVKRSKKSKAEGALHA